MSCSFICLEKEANNTHFNSLTPGVHKKHCVKCVQILSSFWSVISRIRNESGEILRISPDSVQMRKYFVSLWIQPKYEKTRYLDMFHTVKVIHTQTNVQLKVAGLFRYV